MPTMNKPTTSARRQSNTFTMKQPIRLALTTLLVTTASSFAAELRVGLIGLDTSHVIAFTKVLNDPKSKDHVEGAKIVGAFKGGSPDIETSWSRVDKYAEQLQTEFGVPRNSSKADARCSWTACNPRGVSTHPKLDRSQWCHNENGYVCSAATIGLARAFIVTRKILAPDR